MSWRAVQLSSWLPQQSQTITRWSYWPVIVPMPVAGGRRTDRMELLDKFLPRGAADPYRSDSHVPGDGFLLGP